VSFPENGSTYCKITFSAEKSYHFQVSSITGHKEHLQVALRPGTYLREEFTTVESFDAAISKITIWANNIREELSSSGAEPFNIDQIKDEIADYVASKILHPEEKFSTDEINDLRARLAELENRFEELLRKGEITNPEMNSVKQEIQLAETDMYSFPRGVWYKVSLAKVLGTIKNIALSKESREILSGIVKKQLGLD